MKQVQHRYIWNEMAAKTTWYQDQRREKHAKTSEKNVGKEQFDNQSKLTDFNIPNDLLFPEEFVYFIESIFDQFTAVDAFELTQNSVVFFHGFTWFLDTVGGFENNQWNWEHWLNNFLIPTFPF